MAICKLCNKDKDELEFDRPGICRPCAAEHGLPPPTPPLRPAIPCARCTGTAIIRCQVLRDRAATGGDHASAYLAPLAATFALAVDHSFWTARVEHKPDHGKPIGTFEAYVCRGCGYTELYTRDVREIPIGPEYGTELMEIGGEAPYR